MNTIIGKSGKFYVRNPFGGDKYTFAVYPSKEVYDSIGKNRTGKQILPDEYVNSETAFADYSEKSKDPKYLFKVQIGRKQLEPIATDMSGKIFKTGEYFRDYLTSLYAEHGKDNVRYEYEKI